MAPPDRGICKLVPGAVKKDQCEEAHDLQYHRDLDDESKRICKQQIPCGEVIEEGNRRPLPLRRPPPLRIPPRAGGRKTAKRRTRRRRSTRRRRY